ncbi:Rv3235 family protein [Amycolatopsis pittospori]|uniref:Rv3235 family protein n=1 Tax=Amycolatopsis pittospori TaxID=2749434 RepID=UPI0015EFF06E|nr:Rv3235 family protein [Amycolatopsis pittospori]
MTKYVLRRLNPYEPPCRLSARRSRTVHRVPPPDNQLVLDLPLIDGGFTQAPRPGPDTLDRRQVGRLVTTILEACDGRRPAVQVEPILDPALHGVLLGRGRPRPPSGYRPKSIHLCHPADGVIEACATVERNTRFLALVARFERTPNGWVCTRFHLLKPSRRVSALRLVA